MRRNDRVRRVLKGFSYTIYEASWRCYTKRFTSKKAANHWINNLRKKERIKRAA
jgi:hypothetical protein